MDNIVNYDYFFTKIEDTPDVLAVDINYKIDLVFGSTIFPLKHNFRIYLFPPFDERKIFTKCGDEFKQCRLRAEDYEFILEESTIAAKKSAMDKIISTILSIGDIPDNPPEAADEKISIKFNPPILHLQRKNGGQYDSVFSINIKIEGGVTIEIEDKCRIRICSKKGRRFDFIFCEGRESWKCADGGWHLCGKDVLIPHKCFNIIAEYLRDYISFAKSKCRESDRVNNIRKKIFAYYTTAETEGRILVEDDSDFKDLFI